MAIEEENNASMVKHASTIVNTSKIYYLLYVNSPHKYALKTQSPTLVSAHHNVYNVHNVHKQLHQHTSFYDHADLVNAFEDTYSAWECEGGVLRDP